MALPVTTNIASLNAQRNLQKSTLSLNKSLERLSSGQRINHAGDDAAGLAISTGLQSQIRGLNQAVRNSNDGLSLIGTAESAINSYTDILQRIRELAVQSANDTNSTQNRQALDTESNQLLQELQRISTTVEFNGTKLLDGTFIAKQLQVGAQAHQTISMSTGNLQTNVMGQVATITGATVTATTALGSGELVLNGVDVGAASGDGVSSINSSASAIAITNAINSKTALTGVTAEAQPSSLTAAVAAVGAITITPPASQIAINGINIVDVGASVTVGANDATSTLRNSINAKTNQTGVTATLDQTNKLVLTAADGRNIQVVTTGSIGDNLGFVAANDFDNSATPAGGKVKITSNNAIVVSGTAPLARSGLTPGTVVKDPNTAINTVSLASVTGANLAISIVDNSLEQVNGIRANMGAITNRLEQTIQNLQAISENLSASNSRIMDADFATETANMTRNQIMQQAGISILAQANNATQSVLSLLKQ